MFDGGNAVPIVFIHQFLPYRWDQPIVLGVILVFVAAGLLVYYASARRMLRAAGKNGPA